MKKALITGITGQDGSYLAEFLLCKGYEVHGIIRRASTFNTHRIDHIYVDPHTPGAKLILHHGDLSDHGTIDDIIWNVRPDEIYNLGAQSHVMVSFEMPEYTGDISGLGTIRILESIRESGINTKFYQASSSEMFGSAPGPQNERTHFLPRSPYAVAKLYAYWMAVNYREGYNIFASNGILFNHESPRRGETFVTRKITRAIASMLVGKQKRLYLGNLDSKRDWGFAPEYVECMWQILQQDGPDDYAIGHFKIGDVVVKVDPRYFRPTDVTFLQADVSKAKKKLNWETRVSFDELIKIMIDYDLKLVGLTPVGEGIEISKKKGFKYTNHDLSFYLCQIRMHPENE